MSVDWNKPIICKENGARLGGLGGPDRDGDRRCQPIAPDTWPDGYDGLLYVRSDASIIAHSWHVINAPEAADEIPHWAKVRACELANAEGSVARWRPDEVDYLPLLRALARLIAKHEPEPVDPDLLLAREAVADLYAENGLLIIAAEIREGNSDDCFAVQSALRAIKLARERAA